jgi:hypothetical protein
MSFTLPLPFTLWLQVVRAVWCDAVMCGMFVCSHHWTLGIPNYEFTPFLYLSHCGFRCGQECGAMLSCVVCSCAPTIGLWGYRTMNSHLTFTFHIVASGAGRSVVRCCHVWCVREFEARTLARVVARRMLQKLGVWACPSCGTETRLTDQQEILECANCCRASCR